MGDQYQMKMGIGRSKGPHPNAKKIQEWSEGAKSVGSNGVGGIWDGKEFSKAY